METTGILSPISEADYARYLGQEKKGIIEHHGRFWKKHALGFYHPIHYMARMNNKEATRPANLCWGFRTTLCDSDAPLANGTLPVHILSDLENYDLSSIKQSRRTVLRKCWKLVEIVDVKEPGLLLEQGYEVVLSDYGRHKYGRLPSREEYLETIRRFFDWGFPVVAGLREGKLGGFAVGCAIGETAYIEEIQIHSDFLKDNLASGLTYEIGQICKRSPGVKELVHGLHAREKESLCYLKEDLGFKVRHIPSRVWFAPFCEGIIRQRRPHAYYRLCGHD